MGLSPEPRYTYFQHEQHGSSCSAEKQTYGVRPVTMDQWFHTNILSGTAQSRRKEVRDQNKERVHNHRDILHALAKLQVRGVCRPR